MKSKLFFIVISIIFTINFFSFNYTNSVKTENKQFFSPTSQNTELPDSVLSNILEKNQTNIQEVKAYNMFLPKQINTYSYFDRFFKPQIVPHYTTEQSIKKHNLEPYKYYSFENSLGFLNFKFKTPKSFKVLSGDDGILILPENENNFNNKTYISIFNPEPYLYDLFDELTSYPDSILLSAVHSKGYDYADLLINNDHTLLNGFISKQIINDTYVFVTYAYSYIGNKNSEYNYSKKITYHFFVNDVLYAVQLVSYYDKDYSAITTRDINTFFGSLEWYE